MIDSVDCVEGFAFAALIIPRKPDLARHGLHAAVVRPSAKGRQRELLLLLLLSFGVDNGEEEGEGEEEETRRADGGFHDCFVCSRLCVVCVMGLGEKWVRLVQRKLALVVVVIRAGVSPGLG